MESTEPKYGNSSLMNTKIHPPLLAAALILVTLILHFVLPEERLVGWHHVIGLLLVAAGVGLSTFAAAIFQARDTTKIPYGDPGTFVVQAPYTWTRNPMYLGITTALLGLAIFFSSIVMLLAPIAFFIVIDRMVIPREEETMERIFAQQYLDYKNRVRRWI
jgi:protein-S-isoprenylcysteine O-methyltransferase Ste14